MTAKMRGFQPEYSFHPGVFIEEMIEELGIHQTELALRLGISEKHLSNLVNGKVPVTPDMARSLFLVFGYPEKYWLSLQASFDVHQGRKAFQNCYKECSGEFDEWLSQFDYKNLRQMAKFKEVVSGNDTPNRILNLLAFFGCGDISSWNQTYKSELPAACRITGGACAKRGNTVAWIRNGQLIAQEQAPSLPSYQRAAFKRSLDRIRSLSTSEGEDICQQMIRICNESGVLLVFAREIPKSGISGAAFWTHSSEIPCILMNLRYKKNDHFWFTFFHEAVHILNEHKKVVFLDCDDQEVDDRETETNRQAAELLIPSRRYNSFVSGKVPDKVDIFRLAREVGVHPGIVVGRLQHDGIIPWSWFNDIKTTLRWSDL